jgi:hypothetical protein
MHGTLRELQSGLAVQGDDISVPNAMVVLARCVELNQLRRSIRTSAFGARSDCLVRWITNRVRMNLREEQLLDDLWLEQIQQLAQVERPLEAFATRSGLLPERAYRVRDPEASPEKLRRMLTQAGEHVWPCFSHGSQSLVVCRYGVRGAISGA